MRFVYKKILLVNVLLSICITVIFMSFFHVTYVFRKRLVLTLDKNNYLSKDALFKISYEYLPSLPLEYWVNKTGKHLQLNKTCAHFPSPFDVQFQNVYWQNLHSSFGHYQLFGAYLDTRAANPLGPTVRILAMVDQIEPITLMYCQIWFAETEKPLIVKAVKYNLAWHPKFGNYKTGFYQPYLIPCQIPAHYHNFSVTAVSLVEKECDTASNALTVFYNKPPVGQDKHDFAICLKGMDFLLEDISSVLTEWIEMMGLLGAHKIFMYNLQVHPNIKKVLKYYQDLGRIEVVPLTLPAGQPNSLFWQHAYLKNRVTNKRQSEIIPYNDCFYKHMYEYKYIVLVDIDEIIVPLNGATWTDLHQILPKNHDSYNTRNVYYFTDLLFTHKVKEDIPEYMHILNHIHQNPNITQAGYSIKSFHNTETVLSLHNHFPFTCLQGICKNFAIDPKDALMHHYQRKPDDVYTKFRETSIVDTTIWKYKVPLVERVTKTLEELGLLISVT